MEDKKQFFEIYQKVKKEEMNIKTLDSKTTLKILQMLNEEIKINDAIDNIKIKYGKNSIVKASSLLEDSTEIERNKKIGGHHE